MVSWLSKMTLRFLTLSTGLIMADPTVMVVSLAVSFFNINRDANHASSELFSFNCNCCRAHHCWTDDTLLWRTGFQLSNFSSHMEHSNCLSPAYRWQASEYDKLAWPGVWVFKWWVNTYLSSMVCMNWIVHHNKGVHPLRASLHQQTTPRQVSTTSILIAWLLYY